MSYRIAMNVRHGIYDKSALLVAFARVVWPENQDEMEIPSGHLDDERPAIDKIRVWRELGDDIEIIGGKADLSALPLTDALVRQWEIELQAFLPALAEAGIEIVKTEVEQSSGVAVTSRDWETNRAQRAEAFVDAELQTRHKADNLAYARVVARRGCPAERGWSPDLVAEYEAEAKRGLEERVARIRCGGDGKLLLTTLRTTLKYAEAVLGEPTGRPS